MSNALKEYSFRPPTLDGLKSVADSLSPIEHEECLAVTGVTPSDFLTTMYPVSQMREILENSTGKTVGVIGVERESGAVFPWILINKEIKITRDIIRCFQEFLKGLLDENHHVITVLKLSTNTRQVRFLELLGFHRNPGVIYHGKNGAEVHEYIIKRSNT